MNAAITTVNFPLSFLGTNVFTSNIGGCVNVDSIKVDIRGKLNFTNNSRAFFGSAMRISGLSLVSIWMYIHQCSVCIDEMYVIICVGDLLYNYHIKLGVTAPGLKFHYDAVYFYFIIIKPLVALFNHLCSYSNVWTLLIMQLWKSATADKRY